MNAYFWWSSNIEIKYTNKSLSWTHNNIYKLKGVIISSLSPWGFLTKAGKMERKEKDNKGEIKVLGVLLLKLFLFIIRPGDLDQGY